MTSVIDNITQKHLDKNKATTHTPICMMHVTSYFTLYVTSYVCCCAFSNGNNKYKQPRHTDSEDVAKDEAENMLEIYSVADHMLLTSTPYVIALLGQLMLLSTENDFSLAENPPNGGFKHVNYPKSFRASLVQLTNIGWEAFNKAHVNMDSIRLHADNIEHYVKKLVQILKTGTGEEIKVLVPITMGKIEKIAIECVTLSGSIEKNFEHFMEVISEILESSTSAKDVYDEKVQEAERIIKAAKQETKNTLLERERLDKKLGVIEREMQNARGMFSKTVEDMPSNWELMGFKLLDIITLHDIRTYISGGSSVEQQVSMKEDTVSEEDTARQHAYDFAGDIKEQVQILVNIATSGKGKGHKEPNWNDMESVHSLRQAILIVKGHLERGTTKLTDVHEKGINLCIAAIRLSEQFIELSKNLRPKKESIGSLIIEAEDLLLQSEEYLSKSTAFVIRKGISTWWSSSAFTSGFVDSELKKAEMKVEISKKIWEDTRNKQEDTIHRITKNNERMEATLKELASVEITKVDFNEIRNTLLKGLKALSEVRKEWGRIVRYFELFSKLVKINFSQYIEDLSDYATFGSSQISQKGKMLDLTRDLFSKQVSHVIIVTHVVKERSSIYVDMSTKYLIDEISSLGKLAALDPTTDMSEIDQKRKELFVTSSTAQKQITSKITQKREQFKQEVEKKIKIP